MHPRKANKSIAILMILCTVGACLVVANVLYTMITKTHLRSGTNVTQYGYSAESSRKLEAKRGEILDRNGEVIAQDMNTYTLFAYIDNTRKGIGDTPAYVVDTKYTAEKLAPFLDMSYEDVLGYLETAMSNEKYLTYFGVKGKNLSTAAKESIEALELPGIAFSPSSERYYTIGKFASSLIGFAKFDEEKNDIVGQMGIELFLDKELTGSDGEERYLATANNTALPGSRHVTSPAINGNNVVLTLDKNVQMALESSLDTTMKEFEAKRAWAIVMEVETGKILGWSSYPTFDLNEREITDWQNVPSEYLYEPGSVMKAITYAAAIDAKQYPGNDTNFASGEFFIGIDDNAQPFRSSTFKKEIGSIKDAEGKDHGTISLGEGFKLSSNIAICELLTKYFNLKDFETYLDRFGFFKPVNMKYVNEQSGVKNYTYPIEKLTTGFGQGSSVTAIQMVQAYSALLNDGTMMKPYYVDRIENGNTGEVVEQNSPEVAGQPISKEAADQMLELMNRVVNEQGGTGYNRYRMDDVSVIGKTGTGQISEGGNYSSTVYINSVMAAAPYKDPKVMMYYAFESSDYKNFTGEPFKAAFRQALIATGVTGDPNSEGSEQGSSNWKESDMPQLLNHTLEYAKGKLKEGNVRQVVIGNGDSVIEQYPKAEEKIISNQQVFLLTNGDTITMPDMSGWSRKDVMTFVEMAGITITLEGFGTVKEQNIEAGEIITKDTELHITLA